MQLFEFGIQFIVGQLNLYAVFLHGQNRVKISTKAIRKRRHAMPY